MRMNLFKVRVLPIGIDVGSAFVKVAQLQRREDKLELLETARVALPEQCRQDNAKKVDFLADFLRDLLKNRRFRGRRCIISLPASDTFLQHVKIAKVPTDRLAKTLRWELEGKLPFKIDEAVIRHVVVGEVHNEREVGLEVIVVATRRETVDMYLRMANRGKLDVIGLDIEPCAILECFARLLHRETDRSRATLFLDLGRSSTQVVISHGPKLVFARNIMYGSDKIDAAAASALEMSLEDVKVLREKCMAVEDESASEFALFYDAIGEAIEEQVSEINKSLRYYESIFPTRPVQRAIFLGGQAMDKRLCQTIARRLNLPSQIGDPFVRVSAPDEGGEVDAFQARPMWAVAVGLGLGAELTKVA